MFVQVRFLEKIPCASCGHPLIRDGVVVEPIVNVDGTPYEFNEKNPPKSITLGMRCARCGGETRFLRTAANTETHNQTTPPNSITRWSPYVVAETKNT
jgi:ribosomal protein L37E